MSLNSMTGDYEFNKRFLNSQNKTVVFAVLGVLNNNWLQFLLPEFRKILPLLGCTKNGGRGDGEFR